MKKSELRSMIREVLKEELSKNTSVSRFIKEAMDDMEVIWSEAVGENISIAKKDVALAKKLDRKAYDKWLETENLNLTEDDIDELCNKYGILEWCGVELFDKFAQEAGLNWDLIEDTKDTTNDTLSTIFGPVPEASWDDFFGTAQWAADEYYNVSKGEGSTDYSNDELDRLAADWSKLRNAGKLPFSSDECDTVERNFNSIATNLAQGEYKVTYRMKSWPATVKNTELFLDAASQKEAREAFLDHMFDPDSYDYISDMPFDESDIEILKIERA